MARSYGRLSTSMWRDDDFRSLSLAAQWAYQMLLGQPEVTPAGTLPTTLRRWKNFCPSVDVEAALTELSAERFVVIDWDTEELLIRTFVKWDGGANNDTRQRAIISAAQAIESPMLRAVLVREMNRLDLPHGLPDAPSDSPSHAPSDSRRVVVTEVGNVEATTRNPESTTLEPAPQGGDARKRATRTRLPKTWTPGQHLVDWARENGYPDDQCRRWTATFVDHWAGNGELKADWDATWRNWIRRDAERAAQHRPATATDKVVGIGNAAQQAKDMLRARQAQQPPLELPSGA